MTLRLPKVLRSLRPAPQPSNPTMAVYAASGPGEIFPSVVALRSVVQRNPDTFSPLIVADPSQLTSTELQVLKQSAVELLDLRQLPGHGTVADKQLAWAVPQHLAQRGFHHSLKLDFRSLCMGSLDALSGFVDDRIAVAFTKHAGKHGLGNAGREFQLRTGWRLPVKRLPYLEVAFFDNYQAVQADFFGRFTTALNVLEDLRPKNPRNEVLAVAAVGISLGRASGKLPPSMRFSPRGAQRGLQPSTDVKVLHFGDSPRPWDALEFKHVERAVKKGHTLSLPARDAWLAFASGVPGFEDFTSQRSGGPLGRIKLANQMERARQIIDETRERKAAERERRRLDVPVLVWPGGAEADAGEAAHYVTRAEKDQYDFLHLPKPAGEKLFVFFSGHADRSKGRPPIFQRWTWADKFPGHCVFFSDPALLRADRMSVGYYSGSRERDVLNVIAELVDELAQLHGVARENIVTYGSSAGGFASLRIAEHLPGASHIAINPQTDLSLHYPEKINRVAKLLYGADSMQALPGDLQTRFTVHREAVLSQGGRFLVLQNTADEFHFANHYSTLVDYAAAAGMREKISTYEFYHGGGHRSGESNDALAHALEFAERR
ncbi:alpha/beta hydrolase family protein [Nesterenkonia massiliensis]|uniref:alpha/beta hydrolase family protein n=1 Tax=Nesterenkonia massiliensis TaxID=1232429 RepID=UPI000416D517|nr:hypothetical protein [Nesterenkonia massiliensis]